MTLKGGELTDTKQLICEGPCNGDRVTRYDRQIYLWKRTMVAMPDPKDYDFQYTEHDVAGTTATCSTCHTERVYGNDDPAFFGSRA